MRTCSMLILLLFSACAADPDGMPPGADDQFTELAGAYLDGLLAFRPIYASRLGMHAYDGKLPDYSPRAVEAEVARIEKALGQLSSIPAGLLSPRGLTDLEFLRDAMKARILWLSQKPDFKRDPLFYNDVVVEGLEILLRREYAPAVERMKSLVSLLETIPYLFNVARVNLVEVPEILRAAAENPFVNTMYLLREDLPKRIMAQMEGCLPPGFEAAHKKAVYAYTDFIFFIKDQLKEQVLKDCAVGEALYCERWRIEESVDMEVEAALELCRTARADVLKRMADAALLVDPKAELGDIIQRLEQEHQSVKGVTDLAASAAADLKAFTLDKELMTLPEGIDAELRVLAPDPRTTAVVSFYAPAVEESRCTGYVSINPVPFGCSEEEKRASLVFFTPYSIHLLMAGVGYPGRFAQKVKSREYGSLLRQVLESATFTAGWSHYCEQLIIEMGFDPRPQALLTQLNMSLVEINRLEASMRIHCRNESLEEVTAWLAEESFIHPCLAKRFVVEIVRNPMAGAGFIGKAQILKIREAYLAQDEARTLGHFHDLLIAAGQSPVADIATLAFGLKI